MTWKTSTLRTDLGPLLTKGSEVYFRRFNHHQTRPLAAGVCWWLRLVSNCTFNAPIRYFSVSEYLAGEDLKFLLLRSQLPCDDATSFLLDRDLRTWASKLHPGARISDRPMKNRFTNVKANL